MGLHDRDYIRERPLSFMSERRTPAIWWIIALNGLIWVFAAGSARSGGSFGHFVYNQLSLQPEQVMAGEVWRVFTAFWLHAATGISHVFFNMLLLFFLGRAVEARLGTKHFLRLYLLAGLASTLFLVLFYLATKRPFVALGASGAVYGVITWLATVEPRRVVMLFGVFPVPLWLLVGVLMIGGELVTLGKANRPMEPALGHLAGAACGFLLARFGPTYASVTSGKRPPPRSNEPHKLDGRPKADPQVRARVDTLLKKIHDEGIAALSDSEKKFLQDASQRYR